MMMQKKEGRNFGAISLTIQKHLRLWNTSREAVLRLGVEGHLVYSDRKIERGHKGR